MNITSVSDRYPDGKILIRESVYPVGNEELFSTVSGEPRVCNFCGLIWLAFLNIYAFPSDIWKAFSATCVFKSEIKY